MNFAGPLRGVFHNRVQSIYMLGLLVMFGAAMSGGWTDVINWLEVIILGAGLMLLPWVFQRPDAQAFRSRYGWVWALGLTAILALPVVCHMASSPRQVVSTLLLLLYGIPLLRSNRLAAVFAGSLLVLGLGFYLLPYSFFLVEHCRPTPEIWGALIQTNPREAGEYLSSHRCLPALLPTSLAIALLFLCGRQIRPGRPRRRIVYAFMAIFCVNVATGVAGDLYESYCKYLGEVGAWKQMVHERSLGRSRTAFTATAPAAPRKVFLIIGESTTRRHMRLYGYGRPTTPCLDALQREGSLFAFDDVVSPHCLTVQSLEKVLTTADNEHPVPFAESVSLLEVFKRAGFRTCWISNQNRLGEFDNQVSVLASSADQVRFSSIRVGMDLQSVPDDILLPMLERMLPGQTGNALVVCHLMGTHFDYRCRVPQEHRDRLNRKGEVLGAYDQSIHFNDEVVARMIRLAQASGFDLAVYFSDHGEAPHEGRHHTPSRYTPEMVEIPFLVWASPAFRKDNPVTIQRLQQSLHRPYMNDDFFHSLLDLAGVQCSLFDPTRSILNPEFKTRPRRVIDNSIPYVASSEPHPEDDR